MLGWASDLLLKADWRAKHRQFRAMVLAVEKGGAEGETCDPPAAAWWCLPLNARGKMMMIMTMDPFLLERIFPLE